MLPVFGTFINIYILILIYYVDRDREREREKKDTQEWYSIYTEVHAQLVIFALESYIV